MALDIFSDDKYDLTELCLGNKKKKVTENVHIFIPIGSEGT